MKPLDVERHDSGILYIRCVRDGAPFLLALDSGSTLSLAPVEQWPADRTVVMSKSWRQTSTEAAAAIPS